MNRTTLEQFREELLATGAYETPPERCAEKVRKPGLMTRLGMSWSILGVFVHCGLREHFGLLDTDKWAHFCFRAQQKAEGYGTKFHLEGWDNRKAYDGPVVYLSNHMSSLETILLPYVLLSYGPFCTIVKQSLSHIPGVTKAAAHMGLIPIGRANPREDQAGQLDAHLRAGHARAGVRPQGLELDRHEARGEGGRAGGADRGEDGHAADAAGGEGSGEGFRTGGPVEGRAPGLRPRADGFFARDASELVRLDCDEAGIVGDAHGTMKGDGGRPAP